MTTTRVRLSRKPATDEVVCQPTGFLAQTLYDVLTAVLERVAGRKATGSDGRPAHTFPLTALPDVVAGLQRGGLEIDLTTDLVAVIRARAEAAKVSGEAADAWIMRTREKLKVRGEAMRPFQEVGVSFLHGSPAAIEADDMGLGKTAQALLAIPTNSPAIWVTKVSLIGDIQAAAQRWRPDLGIGLKLSERWPDPGTLTICSYDGVPDAPPAGPAPDGTVLIADEAKAIKGGMDVLRVARFQALSDAVGRAPGSRRWLLEGTPLMNRLDELWHLLDRIGLATALFGSRARFRKLAKEDRPQLVSILRRAMIRREKDEVWPEMPRTERSTHLVQITDRDRAALDACLEEIRKVAADKAVERMRADMTAGATPPTAAEEARCREKAYDNVNEAVRLAFDGQIPIPFELVSRVKSILALAKSRHSVAFLRDLVPDLDENGKVTGRPILFFSEHVLPIEQAAAAIPGALAITGAVAQQERVRIIEAFKAGEVPLLCLTGETGGQGLNLPEASTGVWNDRPWNHALVNQAEDRMRRPGQTDDRVLAISVRADHVLDERIDTLITEKQVLSQTTVGRTTIKGNEDAVERPDSLARALEGVLANARETASPAETPREPRGEAERFVAGVLLFRRAALGGNALARSLAEDLKAHGLTPSQWHTAQGVVGTRVKPTPTDRRGPVTAEERAIEKCLVADAHVWRAGDLAVASDLAGGMANGGLTEGQWAFAAFFTRKYRSFLK